LFSLKTISAVNTQRQTALSTCICHFSSLLFMVYNNCYL